MLVKESELHLVVNGKNLAFLKQKVCDGHCSFACSTLSGESTPVLLGKPPPQASSREARRHKYTPNSTLIGSGICTGSKQTNDQRESHLRFSYKETGRHRQTDRDELLPLLELLEKRWM